jgi:hypothetical protein
MMEWKGFVRKRSRSKLGSVPALGGGSGENWGNVFQQRWCPSRYSNRAQPECV